MKRCFGAIMGLLCFCALFAQDKPDWVKERPVNSMYYTGIGMASKQDKDYAQKAKQNALSDLTSEIRVEISVNSLLNTIENDNEVESSFKEEIKMQAKEEIERFQLVDTWQDETEYWVYYQLNMFDYRDYMEARRKKAIGQGLDFWKKGRIAQQQGELILAVEMYGRGMESIQPAINQDLSCSYEGNSINLGNELHASLASVFKGITLVPSVTQVKGKSFSAVEEPIRIRVVKDGINLRNIPLNVRFISGEGDLSLIPPTDEKGESVFYIRNITSKQKNQEISVTIETKFPDSFQKNPFVKKLTAQIFNSMPQANIVVNLESLPINAFIDVARNDNETLSSGVKSILTNNYFNIVNSQSEADVVILLISTFRTGLKIPGEMYDFMECFSSVDIKIMDNRSKSEVLVYSDKDVRTMVPANNSVAKAKGMATRELMKQLNRTFAVKLKGLSL